MDLFVGNSAAKDRLFQNNGDGTFTEITNSPLTNTVINSEGSCWADWDNDGDLDLVVSSGGNQSTGQVRLYENNGAGDFNQKDDGELTTLIGRYEGLTCFDYDRDGDLDLFISNYFNSNNLLYNNNGNGNHWAVISLEGTASNTNGIGSKIYVKAVINGEVVWQMREVIAHSGHVAQGSLNAHFGLGDAISIDSVIVVWPTQVEQVLTDVAVNEYVVIIEEGVSNADELSGFKEAIRFNISPNPVKDHARISFVLDERAFVKLELLDVDGRLVRGLFAGELGRDEQLFDPDFVGLVDGLYFVILEVGGVRILEKVFVVK